MKISTTVITLFILGALTIFAGTVLKLFHLNYANTVLMSGMIVDAIAVILIIVEFATKKRVGNSHKKIDWTVEKIEQIRYRALLGFTVGFALVYLIGIFLFTNLAHHYLIIPFTILVIAAFTIFLIYLYRLLRLRVMAKVDSRLHAILNDDIAKEARNKAYKTGFWVFAISVGIGMSQLASGDINPILILRTIMLLGGGSALIHALIILNPSSSDV